jgi:hypothetical protein
LLQTLQLNIFPGRLGLDPNISGRRFAPFLLYHPQGRICLLQMCQIKVGLLHFCCDGCKLQSSFVIRGSSIITNLFFQLIELFLFVYSPNTFPQVVVSPPDGYSHSSITSQSLQLCVHSNMARRQIQSYWLVATQYWLAATRYCLVATRILLFFGDGCFVFLFSDGCKC